MMPKKSPFHTIGDVLEKVLPKSQWGEKQKQYALWEKWQSLVGVQIAAQATPLRWTKNILVVGVKDSCWLQELRMREQDILEKIRKHSADIQIDGIRWVLAP